MFAGKTHSRICFPGTFSCEMAPRKCRASQEKDSKWMHSFFFSRISQFWFMAISADVLTHIPQRSILMLHVEFMVIHLPASIKSHKLKTPHHPVPLRSDLNELRRLRRTLHAHTCFAYFHQANHTSPPPRSASRIKAN